MFSWLALLFALEACLIHNCLSHIIVEAPDYDVAAEDSYKSGQHPCNRNCTTYGPKMICKYFFEIEHYYTMSKACYSCPFNMTDCFRADCILADGVKRPIVVANRKLPGPEIEVCIGDTIRVDVHNAMTAESTSIHWHGQHQYLRPYMDGVPYVTQCPIAPGNTFRYEFVAENGGTQFWHSHIGMQRGDGLFGPMIVRVPPEFDPNSGLADTDTHYIMVSDWVHVSGMDQFLQHHHAGGDNKITSLLINGLGRSFCPANNTCHNMPVSTFNVKKGFKHRFRLINAEFLNCPIELTIDNHTITVIATDGNPIQPIETHSLVSYAGERFDFVIHANGMVNNYWMRFRGLMDCDARFRSVFQVAILRYEGAPIQDPRGKVTYDYNVTDVNTKQINSLNNGVESNDTISIAELKTYGNSDNILARKVDHQFYISYDFYATDNTIFHRKNLYGFHQVLKKEEKIYTPQLNHISMKLPPFPLLTQRELIQQVSFCNSSTVNNCTTQFCSCTHVLEVKLNSIVELVLIDEGVVYDANHPFHLHGHNFRVVGMERLDSNITRDKVIQLDKNGQLNRNLNQAPIKDTVTVPDGGYTIIRFHAKNPGFWLFHCHIEFHSEIGMALIFKVGEYTDFQPIPKQFPKCGNYIPLNSKNDNQYDNVNINNEKPSKPFYSVLKQTLREIMQDLKYVNSATAIKIESSLLKLYFIVFIFYCKILLI